VYQVGINKGIILRCTAYQISKQAVHCTITLLVKLKTLHTERVVQITFIAVVLFTISSL